MVRRSGICSCFVAPLAVIETFRGKAVILDIRIETIQPISTTLISFLQMILCLIAWKKFLSIFGADVPAYILAGTLVLFFTVLEMTRGINPFSMVIRLFPKHIIYLFP